MEAGPLDAQALYRHTNTSSDITITTILAYCLTGLILLYQVLHYFDPTATQQIHDVLWHALVSITPNRLVLNEAQIKKLGPSPTQSQLLAVKAEAMRHALGLNSNTLLRQVANPAAVLRSMSMSAGTTAAAAIKSNAPPGLGNWDNSCYQNSVLQGLASLASLRRYLQDQDGHTDFADDTTVNSLQETIEKLRDPTNNGRQLWTPAKLKSMSSWQQQDAQEYFSKIMDELDKDVLKALRTRQKSEGLETVAEQQVANTIDAATEAEQGIHNPLEGLLSQQVVCTSCGFSEGLSMIPFNCLTVPLGNAFTYDLQDCLDEYTKLEPITDVECAKCTLIKVQKDLQRMSSPASSQTSPDENPALNKMAQLPPELRQQIFDRLSAVETALGNDDFSDETLNQTCSISKKARVSSTKTRQALIARPPQDLVIHVNRSVFDEMTGMQRKNYAGVRYPATLDFSPWVLGSQHAETNQQGLPREDLWKYVYRIKAIVTHYGRHENGHYIAYRQSKAVVDDDTKEPLQDEGKEKWWQLSDDDVSIMSEEAVLDQGGVFMLFYERVEDAVVPQSLERDAETAASVPPVATVENELTQDESILQFFDSQSAQPDHDNSQLAVADTHAASTDSGSVMTESESEAETAEEPSHHENPQRKSPTYLMRTANADRTNDEHWNVGRFIAAT